MAPTEASWLRDAKQYDEDALSQIYEAYSPELYRYAYRLVGNQAAAEDVVGETFNRFLRALKDGGGPREYLRAYLYRVANNLAIDSHRRNPVPPADLEAVQHRIAAGPSPEDEVVSSLAAEAIRAKLWLLTDAQRQVVVLKYYQGFSNQEVALSLDKPVGAVKALQHRAIDSLRRMMKREEKAREIRREGNYE